MFEQYRDVLSVDEARQALHIGKNTIYNYLQTGELKSIKVGRKYLIPKSFLFDFIEQGRLKAENSV